jgi:hypothetical protein
MDPYLEDPEIWKEFQALFLRHLRDHLAERLPAGYEPHLQERELLVELTPEQAKSLMPGLEMLKSRLQLDNPLDLQLEEGPRRVAITQRFQVPYLTIRRKTSRKRVTVLEVFWPGTKTFCGGHDYLAKREELLEHPVHLVELDLLVSGYRLPLPGPVPDGDYYAVIWPRQQRPHCRIFGWTLRQPIPPLRLPLRESDPDVTVDLGKVFTLAYDSGGFGQKLNYDGAPPAPLDVADLVWMAETVKPKRS